MPMDRRRDSLLRVCDNLCGAVAGPIGTGAEEQQQGQVALHVALKRAMQGKDGAAGPAAKARQKGVTEQPAAKPAKAAAKPNKKTPSAATKPRVRNAPKPRMAIKVSQKTVAVLPAASGYAS